MLEIYYLFLLVITGLGSSLMTMYYPHLKRVITRYSARIRKPKHDYQSQIIRLTTTIVEMQKQIDNIAERQTNRASNLKQQIRREVKNYLEELRND